jgi:hypothetical protein
MQLFHLVYPHIKLMISDNVEFLRYCSREATHRFRTSNNAKSNPEIKGRNSIFFRHDALQVNGNALFTLTPHVFLLNIFINKTERSIHFYWIHLSNKIVTWLTHEYVYLWSKNTWGVEVNNAWPFTCKASCLKKIELRPLISGFDFALLEVRNLCVASRLSSQEKSLLKRKMK